MSNLSEEPYNKIIAESENYYIERCYESAELYSKSDGKRITCAGHFYGDPEGGIIDRNQRFCVTFGCGYIVYYLKEPFEEYSYDRLTDQWIESGREPDNIDWIKSVIQISDNEIEITNEDDEKEIITIPL